MKNKRRNKDLETLIIAILLIMISVILLYLQCVIFKDAQHTVSLIFTNIAFIPLNVFFTAIVIQTLIEKRNNYHKREKLIMIKGVFFSELGSDLLEKFVKHDSGASVISDQAHVSKNWTNKDFKKLEEVIDEHNFEVDVYNLDLEKFSDLLNKNKEFLFSIITNPSLMEHETFSDMIIALFHLKEELKDIYINLDSSCSDRQHLKEDIRRLYRLMSKTWVVYMKHLKDEYPNLFIKAMVHNPFYKGTVIRKFDYTIRGDEF